jgi:hypothetical protein
MKSYADKVSNMGKYGIVRQKGGLSSFHIPNEGVNNQIWVDRYYPEKRSTYHKKLQLGERIALQQHADRNGCSLIIYPKYAIEGRSALAARTRIKTFLNFLESMEDNQITIAIPTGNAGIESLTMVGDWFLAESVSFKDGDGYTNTFFTRNASEIAERIHEFDNEMDNLLAQRGWTKDNSRKKAIDELYKILESLKE